MERHTLVRHLIKAATEFHKRRMWQRFTNFDCFAVRVPGCDDPLVACVMGDAGEQFGLMLMRGPRAMATFVAMTTDDGAGDDAINAMDMLSFSMDPFGDMAPKFQAVFRQAAVHPRYNELVPNILVKPPKRKTRLPDAKEQMLLLLIIKAVVLADRRNLLKPAEPNDPAGVCVLAIEGDWSEPAVAVTRERLTHPPAVTGPQAVAASGLDLSGCTPTDGTWLVGTPFVPVSVEGDDRSLQMLLIADESSSFVVHATPVFADEPTKAFDELVDVFGKHGLPRAIVFTNQSLHDALAHALDQANVACSYVPTHPQLQQIMQDMIGVLGQGQAARDEGDRDPALEDAVPAPDDLSAWKLADNRLSRRFAQHLYEGERPQSERAVKRYFNDDDVLRYMEQHEQRGVMMAYSSWCMLDYRPTKKSQTQAEIMLAAGLPRAEAMLLEARLKSPPTLYRVTDRDPTAGTISLDDVLLGGTVTVHDQLLSENIENGLFLSARAFAAGRFHFIEVIGPPMAAGMGMEAVEFLRDCKLKCTPEGLKQDAHKFGWLWKWLDQWEANWQRPRLYNMDDESLLLHTAAFSVADPQAVRQALQKRQDIDHDESADQFIWFKDAQRNAALGERIALGNIELIGDELVLTVNSAERFARARKWLTELPGVSFIDVTTRHPDEPDVDRPLDEQMDDEPLELTPDMISTIQGQIEQHYMEWLDSPLPVLAGKTPRQACRTAGGREQVTTLIRTMPDPMSIAPIRMPRERMLRELGLPTGGAEVPPPGESIGDWAAPSPRQVGRNAPCPCGSGRKYKKCCGR